ncbi:MAG TPA: aminodeoxychorismate synthase component I [Candidatus Limnocylindria bacterium]|nr:aminodeoxychorismate synthase component I [Candidatus Limnocylindria bacterium]
MALVSLALRREPSAVLRALASEPGALLLDVPDPLRPVTLVSCRPVDELRLPDDEPNPLRRVGKFVARAPLVDATLPFPIAGGVVGYLAYEAGRAVAPRARRHPCPLPLAVLRRYDPLLVFDHGTRQWSLVSSTPERARAGWLARLGAETPLAQGPLAAAPLRAEWDAARYRAAIARIAEYLAAGDVYQVNLTQPFTAALAAPPAALYERLATRHAVPYGAYLDCGAFQILANSPEMLLRRRGERVETRPIKGTCPRGDDPTSDAALAEALRASAKDQAEHVMIVDLERNDLGRVCVPGSVTVERLLALESHPTVHHLVSSVRGRLRRDVDVASLLEAVFPGGSITGAPKVRAMEIIAELEDAPRGVYTGALGIFDPRGDLELGLPIRTAVVRDGTLEYQAGGGIVADSDPDAELAECWLKTAALRRALDPDGATAVALCSSG